MFDPSASKVGTFTLTYTYTNTFGCTNSTTSDITVDPAGNVTIDPIPNQCVAGSIITLTGNPAGGKFSGPGVIAGTNTFDPSRAGLGTHWIVYEFTASACLSNTKDSTQVTVGPQPVVTVTVQPDPSPPCLGNYTIYLGYGPQAITLTAISSVTGANYQWYLNGVAIPGATNAVYNATMSGNYNVIATGSGCPSDSSLTNKIEVHVVDVRCGKDLNKVTVCHPSGKSGKSVELCVEATGATGHLSHGDCLGVCGLTWRMADPDALSTTDFNFNIYPNPFSATTMVEFNVYEPSQVVLEIYDTKGMLVSKLFDSFANSDQYNITIDGSNLPQGIYIAKLSIGDETQHHKLILAR